MLGMVVRSGAHRGLWVCAALWSSPVSAQKPEPNIFAGPEGAVVCSSQGSVQVYQSLLGDDLAIRRFLERERGSCERVPAGAGYIIAGPQLRLRKPGEVDPVYGAPGEWGPSKEQLAEWARENAELAERNAKHRADIERRDAERQSKSALNLNTYPRSPQEKAVESKALMEFIVRRIGQCYRPPVGAAAGLDGLRVRLMFGLNPDGTLAGRPEIAGGASHKNAVEAAERAVVACQPYRLPASQYQLWKHVEVEFDPKRLFNR